MWKQSAGLTDNSPSSQLKERQFSLARSIGRPLRYFIAKRAAGPQLIIAERIDTIFEYLVREGMDDQFHPSYTRMVPAHYITKIELLGCPDPNPVYNRFFKPERNQFDPEKSRTNWERLYKRPLY